MLFIYLFFPVILLIVCVLLPSHHENLSSHILFLLSCSSFQVARETNDELGSVKADPAEGFDVGAILTVARRYRCFRE